MDSPFFTVAAGWLGHVDKPDFRSADCLIQGRIPEIARVSGTAGRDDGAAT